jgi:hypothetical protein
VHAELTTSNRKFFEVPWYLNDTLLYHSAVAQHSAIRFTGLLCPSSTRIRNLLFLFRIDENYEDGSTACFCGRHLESLEWLLIKGVPFGVLVDTTCRLGKLSFKNPSFCTLFVAVKSCIDMV